MFVCPSFEQSLGLVITCKYKEDPRKCLQDRASPLLGTQVGSTHLRAACLHSVHPIGKIVRELDGLRADDVMKGRPTWGRTGAWAKREETKPCVRFESQGQ